MFIMNSEIISDLKIQLKFSENPLSTLRNAFDGKTVIVISAGPSSKMWKNVRAEFIHDKPVIICVKQAIDLVGDECDMHFTNNINLVKYKNSRALRIYTTHVNYPMFDNYDLVFKVDNTYGEIEQSTLCAKRDFENHTLDNSGFIRPWGPGIMHETVFYALLHMGFKKIITIGWDIADSNGANIHFNDNKNITSTVNKKNIFRAPLLMMLNKYKLLILFGRFQYVLRYFFNFLKFKKGLKVFKAAMQEGEAQVVAESTEDFKKWLNSKGVDLIIRGGSKWHQ